MLSLLLKMLRYGYSSAYNGEGDMLRLADIFSINYPLAKLSVKSLSDLSLALLKADLGLQSP